MIFLPKVWAQGIEAIRLAKPQQSDPRNADPSEIRAYPIWNNIAFRSIHTAHLEVWRHEMNLNRIGDILAPEANERFATSEEIEEYALQQGLSRKIATSLREEWPKILKSIPDILKEKIKGEYREFPINKSEPAYKMMLAMGWKEGGIGKNLQGTTTLPPDGIPKNDKLGIDITRTTLRRVSTSRKSTPQHWRELYCTGEGEVREYATDVAYEH